MPCFALQNRGGKLNRLYARFVVNGRCTPFGAALCHHVTCAGFATPALGGNAKLKLDFIKAHASMGMTSDLSVRNSVAYTNDHGCKQCGWLLM